MKKQRRGSNGQGSPADVAGLLRDLATRERQLRDLTEQSLGFLEELAESRRRNGEREQLVARLSELERALTDAKRRLRTVGGAATDAKGANRKERAAIAIVFHGADSLPQAAAAARLGDVVWVGLPDAVSAAGGPGGVTIVTNRDARTMAQCWNLGMAATTADAVLFVAGGGDVRELGALPADLPANTALLAPRIERGDRAELGQDQAAEPLRLVPRPAGEVGEPFVRVPWPCADAFFVRRAAFERLGTFDEGLIGPAALLEYVLRARRANFDVLGVPKTVVAAPPRTAAEESVDAARERIVVIAAHRPDQLGQALADSPILWELERNEAPGWLAQVLARLPSAEGAPDQRSMLERTALGLVQYGMPAARVRALLADARSALLRGFAQAGTVVPSDEFVAAAQRADEQRGMDPAAAFAAFANDIARCRDAATATARELERTREQLREFDAQRHAQSDRAERAEGARQHAQKQIEQMETWLRERDEELRRAQASRAKAETALAESQASLRQRDDELAVAKRDREGLAVAKRDLAASEAALRDEKRERALLAERLEATRQQHRELEREYLATDTDLRAMRDQVSRMAGILGVVADADSSNLQQRLGVVHEQAQELVSTLRSAGATDSAQLLQRLDELSQRLAATEHTVRERERWIALLLQEVSRRRVFPRALQPHEQALVDRSGRAP